MAGHRVLSAPFVVLTLAATSYFTAQGMLFPTLPRFVESRLGGGGLAVGLVVGSFALGALAARPIAGVLADRSGRRIVVSAGAALWAITVTAYVWTDGGGGSSALVGLRVVGGFGSGAMFVALAALATDLLPAGRRVQGFSLFSISVLVGFAVGPIVGESVADGHRFGLVFAVAVALAAVLVAGIWLVPDTAARGAGRRRGGVLHPAGILPGSLLVLGSFGFISFTAFVPLHAHQLGIDSVAGAFAVVSVTTLTTRVLAAGLPDRVDLVVLAAASMLTVAAAAVVLAGWAALAGIYLGAVLHGLGNSFLFPAFLAITVERAPDDERAAAIGSVTAFNDVAHSAGGAVLGAMVALAGYRAAFATAGACGAVGTLALLARARALRPTM